MTLLLPRISEPVVNSNTGIIGRSWRQLFVELVTLLGFDNDTAVFEQIFVSGHNMASPGATTNITGTVLGAGFATGADNESYFSIRLPNNYKAGTALKTYVEWAPNDTGTGNVKWNLEYVHADPLEAMSSASTLTSVDAASGTADQIEQLQLTDISGTGLKKGTNIVFRIEREGTDPTDTYGGTAILLGVGVKYQVQGIGTRKVYP